MDNKSTNNLKRDKVKTEKVQKSIQEKLNTMEVELQRAKNSIEKDIYSPSALLQIFSLSKTIKSISTEMIALRTSTSSNSTEESPEESCN